VVEPWPERKQSRSRCLLMLDGEEKEAGNFDLTKSERQKRRNRRVTGLAHGGGARTSDATQPTKSAILSVLAQHAKPLWIAQGCI